MNSRNLSYLIVWKIELNAFNFQKSGKIKIYLAEVEQA